MKLLNLSGMGTSELCSRRKGFQERESWGKGELERGIREGEEMEARMKTRE